MAKEIQNQNLVEKKPLINLVLKPATYKIIIPEEVENKIKFICQKVWDTEWSGTLFFTHTGGFETNDLVITCVDIFVMDIGTATYTEFDMSPDVISYMTENMELLDCQMGLIHSHNNMPTFFSGTDTATLRAEGVDRNNFVSLIVNNAGKYTAAITRMVKATRQVTENYSYEIFGDGTVNSTNQYSQEIEELQYFFLNIEKQGSNHSFETIEQRLSEIKVIKANKAKIANSISTPYNPSFTGYKGSTGGFNNTAVFGYQAAQFGNTSKREEQKELFNKEDFDENSNYLPFSEIEDDETKIIIPAGVHFNKDKIKSLVLQLVTGSIIIPNGSKIDIAKWIHSMPSLYQARFGKDEEGFKLFTYWCELYVEFLVWYTYDEDLETVLQCDDDITASICARDMLAELKRLPSNIYMDKFKEILTKYAEL